ncbi:hypothetical protein FRC06_011030 [Ceratobasidium sp. 370]|nr:hypothetical protein FRC06_011030 [Ceratobasidium sp. 370]
MLPAVPIALASGFMWLLALTSRVTLSQIYTASAVVYYGNQLARTAVESVLLLPVPGYVQEGHGIPTGLAAFVALSPIGSPAGHASPTLGECVGVVSSTMTSFVRNGRSKALHLVAAIRTLSSLTASIPLTLEPYVSVLGNGSAVDSATFRSLYPGYFFATPPDLHTSSRTFIRGSEDAHLALADSVLVKSPLPPNICTFSSPGLCGLGHYDKDDSNPRLGLDFCVYAPPSLDSCGLGTQNFSHPSPPVDHVVCHPDWLDPDTAGSWLLACFLVAVQFWIVYRLVDVAHTDLMVAAPGVVQATNGTVYRCNCVLPAAHPLDFFKLHLFDIRDTTRFFIPLPREEPAVGLPAQVAVNLEELGRYTAKEKRWDEEMGVERAKLDALFKQSRMRLDEMRRGAKHMMGANGPRGRTGAQLGRQKEGGGGGGVAGAREG